MILRFLWVDLQMETLCRMRLEIDIKNAAQKLSTKTLHSLYAQIVNSITDDGPAASVVARRAFSWLLCSYEAHSPSSFLSAVTTADRDDVKEINDVSTLTHVCRGLVVVDAKMDVVRFMHSSLQEFLTTMDEFTLYKCHSIAAETCLTVCTRGSDTMTPAETPRVGGFYDYCALNWARHCHHAEPHTSSNTLTHAMINFAFDGYSTSLSFLDWLANVNDLVECLPYHHVLRKPLDAVSKAAGTPFYAACAFGLLPLLDHVGAIKSTDCNLRSSLGHTGMYLAAVYGHTAIVRFLLQKGAEASPHGGHFGTPLYAAAFKGHIAVVKALLECRTGEDLRKASETALQAAITSGQERVALTVFKSGFLTYRREGHDEMMMRAAQAGFIDVMNHLHEKLKHEAENPASSLVNARLIESAVIKGSYSVLQRLLATLPNQAEGARPKLPIDAILLASRGGHIDIILLLLEHGADIEYEGGHGRPLRVASLMGHERTVRTLLDRGANVNAHGVHGEPLQASAMQGHLGITRSLLQAGATIGRRGGLYGNALEAAVVRGHLPVVKELLKSDPFDPPHLKCEVVEESFNAAVIAGQEDVVRLFTEVDIKFPLRLPRPQASQMVTYNQDLVQAASPRWSHAQEDTKDKVVLRQSRKSLTSQKLEKSCWVLFETTTYRQDSILLRNRSRFVESRDASLQRRSDRTVSDEALSIEGLRKLPPLVGCTLGNRESILRLLLQTNHMSNTYINKESLGQALLTALENDYPRVVDLLLDQPYEDPETVMVALKDLVSYGDCRMVKKLVRILDGMQTSPERERDFLIQHWPRDIHKVSLN